MPFQDLPEGQTHYQGDNCGIAEHNPKENWEEKLEEVFIAKDHPDLPKQQWSGTSVAEWKKNIKSFIRQNFVPRENIEKAIKKIAEWSEPQPGAGEGLGALAGAGMYQQYDADKNKHEKQISDLRRELLDKEK